MVLVFLALFVCAGVLVSVKEVRNRDKGQKAVAVCMGADFGRDEAR